MISFHFYQRIHNNSEFHYFSELLDNKICFVILNEVKNLMLLTCYSERSEESIFIFSSPLEKEGIEGRFEKNSLFHRKCEKICKKFFLDYT
jgi:hypothetical protein